MSTTEKIESALVAPVAEMGYELIDVEFKKEDGNWVLTLYIDSPNGITIDDCEAVSRRVDPILDELDPIEQAYYLSVSSPGLDRPIKKDRDFERNIGKMVQVKLYAPLEGKKEWKGTLEAFDCKSFTLQLDKKSMVILRKNAAMVRPHIEF